MTSLKVRQFRGDEIIVRPLAALHPPRLMLEPRLGNQVVGVDQVAGSRLADDPRGARRFQPRPAPRLPLPKPPRKHKARQTGKPWLRRQKQIVID